MKICFIIPFYYKWNNYANIKSNYEYLQEIGYEVDVYNKNKKPIIDFSKYDLVMLHGSGAFLTGEQFNNCNIPILGFGWSDPNLFNEYQWEQSTFYCTNDLGLSKKLKGKPVYFYNTACDKRYHVDLCLPKITDILVYGSGNHRWVTERNNVVNKLRNLGYKIKVFGRGWDKHSDTFGFIEGEELSKEICQAHLLLDITNKTTAWSHRDFESSARATPVLTIDREDTRSMFADDEIYYYDNYEEIPNILNSLLSNKELLRQTGLKAQQRCYKDHDISVRILQLNKIIKEIL
jgi:glycosyltransferase involved in cell wall biosynthesis